MLLPACNTCSPSNAVLDIHVRNTIAFEEVLQALYLEKPVCSATITWSRKSIIREQLSTFIQECFVCTAENCETLIPSVQRVLAPIMTSSALNLSSYATLLACEMHWIFYRVQSSSCSCSGRVGADFQFICWWPTAQRLAVHVWWLSTINFGCIHLPVSWEQYM